MSQSASQAHAFYREVAKEGIVWSIKDAGGFPAPVGDEGKRAMPFWSSRSRAEKIIQTVAAYDQFVPVAISWVQFRDAWLPGLEKDGLQVGVNWSGQNATGYDLAPKWVREAIELQIKAQETA